MIAFHGKKEIKKTYVARVLAHQKADEIIKGHYWEGGKGCAVGCTLHSSDHGAYETELGIPKWLAEIEDVLFEKMSKKRSKLFPAQFLKAINVGSDLETVKVPLMIFILQSALEKFDHAKFPDCKKAIDTVIDLYRTGETDSDKFKNAAWAAESASDAAYNPSANAVGFGAFAAESAANAAVYVAYADISESIFHVSTLTNVAATYEKFADKLLELMRECK